MCEHPASLSPPNPSHSAPRTSHLHLHLTAPRALSWARAPPNERMTSELRDRLQATLGDAFRLERELGGGGMSRVFVAEDVSLGRRVVVKVLSPELAAGVNVDRFKREIQLAAGLQHPHVVPVLAAGQTDGLPYYTMPFVDGRSLRDKLAGGKALPVLEAVGILRDVARALAYAHERGVVHRDVKPDNVLLTGGSAAVTDFGIAKAISSARANRTLEPGEALTMVGSSLGTPAYMAPEQVAADPQIDHRADIYSFGVMAYELLTGVTPFHGRAPHQLLAAHVAEAPQPIAARAQGVPPALAALVMRCLAKSPGDRPQTAAELAAALDHLDLSGDWTGPGIARRRSRLRLLVAAAIVVVLAIVGFAVWRFRSTGDRSEDRLVAVVPFRIASADPALHYLREGMLDLLASKLTGEGGMRATEPRVLLDAWRRAGGGDRIDLSRADALQLARALGAGRLLLGDVVGTPTRIVLTASLLRAPEGDSLVRVSVEGPPDSLAWLVDRLAARLLTQTSQEGEARLASLTSTSLPALRAYLDGQAKLRRGDVVNSAKDFDRALELDSTFALAGLGLRLAASWYGDPERSHRGLVVAWREKEKLGVRDRALLVAVDGPNFPARSSTQEIYDARLRYLGLARDRAEAWYLVGDHVFHYGYVLGIDDPPTVALQHFRKATDLDSTYVVGYIHALQLAVQLGDTALANRLERLRLAADTSRYWQMQQRWIVAQHRGDSATMRAMWDSLPEDPRGVYSGMMQYALGTGLGVPDARRAVDAFIAQTEEPAARRSLQQLAHDWALVTGRPEVALARLDSAFPDTAGQPDINRLVLHVRDALVGDGDSAAAVRAAARLAEIEARPLPADSVGLTRQRATIRALEPWRLARGDTTHARRSIDRLRAVLRAAPWMAGTDAEVEIAVIEAMHAHAARRPDAGAAVERLDSLLRATDWTNTHGGRAALATLVAARLLEQRGETERAWRAARRRVEWNAASAPYFAAQLREEGRLAALLGRREDAIRAYRHFLALRYDPSPSLRPQVEEVRRELARLERESVGR